MSIKNTVANMLGMKFGSYNASVKNMENVYQNKNTEHSTYKSIIVKNDIMYYKNYYGENGKGVATASYLESNGEYNYSVLDKKMKREYSSGWNNGSSDKFNYITFGEYAVEDANKNGVLDEADLIYLNDGQGNKQTIKEFLG